MKDEEEGDPIFLEDVHLEWCKHIIRQWYADDRKYVGIMAPFEHGKSVNVIGFILWAILQNQEYKIQVICNSDGNATKRVTTCRDYIASDPEFQRLFGHLVKIDKSKWTEHSLKVKRKSKAKDPTLEAFSVLSANMGARSDIQIYDDVCDLKNSVLSATERKKVKIMCNQQWLGKLSKGGFAVNICTAWHEEDWNHELIGHPDWTWLIQRISEDKTHIEQVVV